MFSTEQIKTLRDKTGGSINECKKALEEAGGNLEKAEKVLEKRLGGLAGKRLGRETKAGVVDTYIHSDGRIGAMVELFCETDFVARNPVFKSLAHDLAMHIAAFCPAYLSLDAVPQEVWQAEKNRFEEEARGLDKPSHIIQEIVDGKLKSHFDSISLLEQPFIKDQDKKVSDVVNEAIGKFGENIKVGRFVRFEL
ncbi:MAG: Elongation factor Ts [Parcubacteria group bacterium GW2011_GWA2_42_14]|nr:MAG: Elongation factor Ts [Parcubacteria group bacterium GW2011_GWA2_42_14]OGZ99436.1 MAG: elongation factor Ts [Candidatus Sungbacteria bacterium RIFCSPHIGHO2_02_FULL_41_12b]